MLRSKIKGASFLFLTQFKVRKREYKMKDIEMITQKKLAKLMHCSERNVTFLRELGIIPAIKIGRNYMFSPIAIQKFYDDYAGLDVSNRIKAMQSKEIVESRKGQKRYG